MIYEMQRFFGTNVGCSNNCVVYTVLYVFLTSVGLCCKIDYNLEIEVKIMTFELCFIRCGNFFWEGAEM